jgi:hypothetical protein
VTFRPSPLAYALAVLVAWLACLAIAFDRAELLFIAVPLVLRLAQSLPPAEADIGSFALATDGVAPSEGDAFTLTIDARLTAATGLVQVLPALPEQVGTSYRTAVFSNQMAGCAGTSRCCAASAACWTSMRCFSGNGTAAASGSARRDGTSRSVSRYVRLR